MGRLGSILTAIALLAFSFSTPPTLAADDSSLADQLKKVKTEYDVARENFQKNYSAAKTDEEREKISQTYPQPDAYVDRIMAIADKAPKSDVERDAMIWILEKVYYTPNAEKAIERLQANHIKSPDLRPALQMLAYSQSDKAPAFLRAIIKENPDKKLQAYATYILGYALISRDSDKNRAEAEKLFETVRADFKDVDADLVKLTESELYEIRNLSIGQVAPDIKGSDVDGKEFALSEYRGRVVVLDFWGDW
jgi:hypothetical protein